MNKWKLSFFICATVLVISHAPGVTSFLSIRDARELEKPPIATQYQNSKELIRIWTVPDGPNQFVIDPVWEDAGYWGILLVDVARHAAKAHVRKFGGSEDEALQRIGKLYSAEWQQHTSPAEVVQ